MPEQEHLYVNCDSPRTAQTLVDPEFFYMVGSCGKGDPSTRANHLGFRVRPLAREPYLATTVTTVDEPALPKASKALDCSW
jgi:hypothetical protein